MNFIPVLKNEQTRLKREINAIDTVVNKLIRNEYKERRQRLRNDRPVGAEDKHRAKEIAAKQDKLSIERRVLQTAVWHLGDAICRLREINRGNSKRCVGSVFKQLITGSK